MIKNIIKLTMQYYTSLMNRQNFESFIDQR